MLLPRYWNLNYINATRTSAACVQKRCQRFGQNWVEIKRHFFLKANTLYPGGIRSGDPYLQSPRWQAETIPLDHVARAREMCRYFYKLSWHFTLSAWRSGHRIHFRKKTRVRIPTGYNVFRGKRIAGVYKWLNMHFCVLKREINDWP
jgi:hypothetical protein